MKRFLERFDARTGAISAVRAFFRNPSPSRGGWLFTLGSVALFLVLLQFGTGALLALAYAPTPDHARESVWFIEKRMPAGSLVRGLHSWGASLLVVIALAHLFRVLYHGSYKDPRRENWWIGLALLAVILAFAFTGYLLPWDQKGYWATVVGVRIAATVPGIGASIGKLLSGGGRVGASALTRFATAHFVLLPAAAAVLVLPHLLLLRRHGHAGLPGDESPREPFFPNQTARDAVAIAIAFGLLLALAHFAPAPLEATADPSDSGYVPRPDWYFLSLFQLLHYFPGQTAVVGAVLIPAAIALLLFALPLLDRSAEREPKRRRAWIALGARDLRRGRIPHVDRGSRTARLGPPRHGGASPAAARVRFRGSAQLRRVVSFAGRRARREAHRDEEMPRMPSRQRRRKRQRDRAEARRGAADARLADRALQGPAGPRPALEDAALRQPPGARPAGHRELLTGTALRAGSRCRRAAGGASSEHGRVPSAPREPPGNSAGEAPPARRRTSEPPPAQARRRGQCHSSAAAHRSPSSPPSRRRDSGLRQAREHGRPGPERREGRSPRPVRSSRQIRAQHEVHQNPEPLAVRRGRVAVPDPGHRHLTGRVAKSKRLSDPLLRRHPPVDFRLNRRGARARVGGSRRRIRHDGILRRRSTRRRPSTTFLYRGSRTSRAICSRCRRHWTMHRANTGAWRPRRGRPPGSANLNDPHADLQTLPTSISGQHRRTQSKAEREARSVPKRESLIARLAPKLACCECHLFVKVVNFEAETAD